MTIGHSPPAAGETYGQVVSADSIGGLRFRKGRSLC
jgi:hypothetical protein